VKTHTLIKFEETKFIEKPCYITTSSRHEIILCHMISMHVYKKKRQRQRCAETEMYRDRGVQRQRCTETERVGICGCAGQGKAMTGLECRGVQRSGVELTEFFFDGPSSSLMARVLL
jgi:hypothetical protein